MTQESEKAGRPPSGRIVINMEKERSEAKPNMKLHGHDIGLCNNDCQERVKTFILKYYSTLSVDMALWLLGMHPPPNRK